MKKIYVSVCFYLLMSSLFSQPAIQWQRCFGGSNIDLASSFKQTNDDGYIMSGWTASNDSGISSKGGADYWIVKTDSNGIIQWQRSYGGTKNDYVYSVIQTKDNGYAVVGIDYSLDGDVSGNHGLYTCWILKLDSVGAIQWSNCYGGSSSNDYGQSIIQTTDGGFVIGGSTFSNDGDASGNHGFFTMDFWLFKLNSSGAIQWKKCYGGTGMDQLLSLVQTKDNGFVMAGSTNSNDGNVSGNHGASNYDGWIVKVDSIGTIQWQKCLGGTGYDDITCIVQSTDGAYIGIGTSDSNDGDVSGNHGGLYDAWVVKLDSLGNIQWQKCLGGSDRDEPRNVIQAKDGNYVVSINTQSHDGDINQNHGDYDAWIAKLDSLGSIVWRKSLGGTQTDFGSIIQIKDGNYTIAGGTISNNGDVSGNHGLHDMWLVKLANNYNDITGTAYCDLNSNNVYDGGDALASNAKITEASTNHFTFTDYNGTYHLAVLDSGNYTTIPANINYYNSIPYSHSVHFSFINQIDSLNDFAFQPIGSFNDLSISLTPVGHFGTQHDALYYLDYKNVGTTTLSGQIIFIVDSNIMFISSDVSPTYISTDSITWSFSNLLPYTSGKIVVTVHVKSNAVIGTKINSLARIEPIVGDATPSDNVTSWENPVTVSQDPNLKLVSDTILTTAQASSGKYLDYIINFQNTGTDTAFNVNVFDNISPLLDINSFEFVSSSHPVKIEYKDYSRLFVFKFDNILLPDSNVNEIASHGFIRFHIKPLSNISSSKNIFNAAAIYFDNNAPVPTDSVKTEIVLTAQVNNIINSSSDLIVYPNPMTEFVTIRFSDEINDGEIGIFDVFGRSIFRRNVLREKQITINASVFAKGVYFIQFNDYHKIYRTKLVKE